MFVFVDLFVLLLVLGLARTGWKRGFASQAIDLAGFAIAMILAVRFYEPLSAPFRWMGISAGWAAFAGGCLIFVPLIVATAYVGAKAGRVARQPGLNLTNRILGTGFGVLIAAVGLTFALLVTQFAPVPLGLADAVRRSPTAKLLLSTASPATRVLERVAERDADKVILFIRQGLRTLRTPRDEKPSEAEEGPALQLAPIEASKLKRDAKAEQELLRLVNEERTKRKLRPVAWDDRLADVGRDHSEDMYVRGYFAHRSPDGETPSDRLHEARISYLVSGENLALAPSVALAHDGLMKSPGHRRNILDPDYSRLGIGIMNGPHGLMASQEFCGGC